MRSAHNLSNMRQEEASFYLWVTVHELVVVRLHLLFFHSLLTSSSGAALLF